MIRSKIKLVILITAMTFWVSCTLNNEPGKAENESSVIFNLVANKNIQKFYLYRTVDLEDNARGYHRGINYSEFFIKNAEVQLEGNDLYYNDFVVVEDDEFSHNKKGFQYRTNDSLAILPRTKYNLLINYDGIEINGRTTTPGDFEIWAPKDNAIIKRTNAEENVAFDINWNKSNNAKGYIITRVDLDDLYSRSFITADTTYYYSGNMVPGNYRLEILAYDENIDNYLNKDYYKSGLENAYGYFGSSVLKSVEFEVR